MDTRDKIIADQSKIILDQAKIIESLKQQIVVLEEKIVHLEHRLGLNSNNSSKPPSSDGLGKKNTIPKSQIGKKAKARKKRSKPTRLKQVSSPDLIISYEPGSCNKCGEDLSATTSDKHEKRQVFDLPEEQKLIVSEHRLCRKICPCCSNKNYGQAPSYVTGHTQYGPNLGGLCIYFYNVHMLPYKRISEIIEALYGQRLSEQVIIDYINEYGQISKPYGAVIEKNIRESKLAHHDETGFRVSGKLHWIMTSGNELWSKYWVSAKRGEVLKGLTNFMVRDCFRPYDTYNTQATMALCNAHILRELEAIKDDREWARKMHKLLILLCRVKNRYLAQDIEIPLKLQEIATDRYDKIVRDAYYIINKNPPKANTIEGKSFALLNRLIKRKQDVLRFLAHKIVPFTNNLAERDLRMMKVKQKVSGCFRTLAGAVIFCSARGVIKSLIKQNAKILASISTALKTGTIDFPELATSGL
jgi:transposase